MLLDGKAQINPPKVQILHLSRVVVVTHSWNFPAKDVVMSLTCFVVGKICFARSRVASMTGAEGKEGFRLGVYLLCYVRR